MNFVSFPHLPTLTSHLFQQTSCDSLRGFNSHISEAENADSTYNAGLVS
jgi:hypothetical protein